MRALVGGGELATLSPERVWQELARGLLEPRPSRMLAVLRECGALAQVLPEVDALFGVPQPVAHHPEFDTGVHVALALDYAAARGFALAGALRGARARSRQGRDRARRVARAPPARSAQRPARGRGCRRGCGCPSSAAMRRGSRRGGTAPSIGPRELRPATLLDLFARSDALRRPERLEGLLEACECDALSRPGRGRFRLRAGGDHPRGAAPWCAACGSPPSRRMRSCARDDGGDADIGDGDPRRAAARAARLEARRERDGDPRAVSERARARRRDQIR